MRGPMMSNALARVGGKPVVSERSIAPLSERVFLESLLIDFDAESVTGSNGASVSNWTDQESGLVASGGVSPTLRTSGNSTLTGAPQAVRFAKASTQRLACDAIGAVVSNGGGTIPFTLAVVLRIASNDANNVVGLGKASGSNILQCQFTGGTPNLYDSAFRPGNGVRPLAYTDEDAFAVYEVNPGGTSAVTLNGERVAFTLPSNANQWTKVFLGAVNFNGNPVNHLDADVRRICIFDGILDAAGHAAAALEMGAVDMGRIQEVYLGDSLTVGVGGYSALTAGWNSLAWAGSTAYTQYAVRLNAGQIYECTSPGTSAASGGPTGTGSAISDGGATWRWINEALPPTGVGLAASSYPRFTGINRAVAGRTLVDIAGSGQSNQYDNLAADITSLYNQRIPRIVYVFLGTNDKFFGATDDEAEASYWMVVDTIRAANPSDYIVAITPMKRGDGTDTTGLAARIRANWHGHADNIADAAAVSTLHDTSDAVLWNADTVHLKAPGYTELCKEAFDFATYRHGARVKSLNRMLRGLP